MKMSNNIMQMGFQRNEERPPPLSTSTILSPLARMSAVNNIIQEEEEEVIDYVRLTNRRGTLSSLMYKIFFIGSWITFPPFRVV